ncbi:MAG TPA: hypothetical protein VKV32_16890 [Stellaceae bacterium]|nr:hypothetical protein [Stellaceae bacterium]
MAPHTHTDHAHYHATAHHRPGLLDRRFLGISGRYWVISGIVLGVCLSIYEVSGPISPDAFDQPGAQVPNQLRSPWGVKNPL